MPTNIDSKFKFNDGAGHPFQYHIVLLLDLIFRQNIVINKFDKIKFQSRKKYGRPELEKNLLKIRRKTEDIRNKSTYADILVGGHGECFEDINLLYKNNNKKEKHIFIQVKGNRTHQGFATDKFKKKIIRNFFKNCNYEDSNSRFIVISNFYINKNIHKFINELSTDQEIEENNMKHLLDILFDKLYTKKQYKNMFTDQAIVKTCIKVINETKIEKDEQREIEKTTNMNITQLKDKFNKLINVIKNIVIIEYISFTEITELLKDYYIDQDHLDIEIMKITRLSSEKANIDKDNKLFKKYTYYNNTYFFPKKLAINLNVIEDGNFIDIIKKPTF